VGHVLPWPSRALLSLARPLPRLLAPCSPRTMRPVIWPTYACPCLGPSRPSLRLERSCANFRILLRLWLVHALLVLVLAPMPPTPRFDLGHLGQLRDPPGSNLPRLGHTLLRNGFKTRGGEKPYGLPPRCTIWPSRAKSLLGPPGTGVSNHSSSRPPSSPQWNLQSVAPPAPSPIPPF
jgi:hypothetical protein